MRSVKRIKTLIQRNEQLEGIDLETNVAQIVAGAATNTTPIPELIYTEREAGVLPQYNHRADKWEIAQEAATLKAEKHREKRVQTHIKLNEAAAAAKAAEAAKAEAAAKE